MERCTSPPSTSDSIRRHRIHHVREEYRNDGYLRPRKKIHLNQAYLFSLRERKKQIKAAASLSTYCICSYVYILYSVERFGVLEWGEAKKTRVEIIKNQGKNQGKNR